MYMAFHSIKSARDIRCLQSLSELNKNTWVAIHRANKYLKSQTQNSQVNDAMDAAARDFQGVRTGWHADKDNSQNPQHHHDQTSPAEDMSHQGGLVRAPVVLASKRNDHDQRDELYGSTGLVIQRPIR
jgi:hypothetical protein